MEIDFFRKSFFLGKKLFEFIIVYEVCVWCVCWIFFYLNGIEYIFFLVTIFDFFLDI